MGGTLRSGGRTPDELMVVTVPIVPESRCQIEYPFQIAKSMICAGEYGKDSCQGDSGGPMVCYMLMAQATLEESSAGVLDVEVCSTLESTPRSPTSSTGLRRTHPLHRPLLPKRRPPPWLRPPCHSPL